MKKLFLIVLFYFFSNQIFTQPQWKFHVAFEDATGAKDTIWLVWDTTAHITLPLDTALGEGSIQMNLSNFNVFVGNANNDSTKTIALPFNVYPIMETAIGGFNFSYPIQISWDTALFHASYLPFQQGTILSACITNDYFYFVNNDPMSECYNMLIDNHAEAPYFNWGPQNHFPMFFHFDGHGVNIENISTDNFYSVFPNPVCNIFSITSQIPIKGFSIFNFFGHEVYTYKFNNNVNLQEIESIDVSILPNGIYFLKIETVKNIKYYEKIVKVN